MKKDDKRTCPDKLWVKKMKISHDVSSAYILYKHTVAVSLFCFFFELVSNSVRICRCVVLQACLKEKFETKKGQKATRESMEVTDPGKT